jgi:hypothetical protein
MAGRRRHTAAVTHIRKVTRKRRTRRSGKRSAIKA